MNKYLITVCSYKKTMPEAIAFREIYESASIVSNAASSLSMYTLEADVNIQTFFPVLLHKYPTHSPL